MNCWRPCPSQTKGGSRPNWTVGAFPRFRGEVTPAGPLSPAFEPQILCGRPMRMARNSAARPVARRAPGVRKELVLHAGERIAKNNVRTGRARERRDGRFARQCSAERRHKSRRAGMGGRRRTGCSPARTITRRLSHDRSRRCRSRRRWSRRIGCRCSSGWRGRRRFQSRRRCGRCRTRCRRSSGRRRGRGYRRKRRLQ